jgi:2-dehydro-3-deoxygluconokinase
MTELVTFGEALLRLTPAAGERLDAVDTLDLRVGGPEANVAAAAAQLGVSAAWLSKLPDTPLGRRVARGVRAQGVEPAVRWTDEGRAGAYYVEDVGEPRGSAVHYDREGVAVHTATTDELPVERVSDAAAFFVSGATLALSKTLAGTVADLFRTAREADTATVFCVDYRPDLWSVDAARETLTDLLPGVDVLFVSEADAETVFDHDHDPSALATKLVDEFDHDAVVVTRGEHGSLARRDGEVREQDAIPADTHDGRGTGDAFVGGYLARRLRGGSVAEGLTWGAAVASLTGTVPGDIAVVTPEEVEAVVAVADEEDRDRVR